MIWQKPLGITELAFIIAFIVLYLLYIIRIVWIAKAMRSETRPVLLKLALRSVYFSLIIISLLGPSFGDIKKEVKTSGKDIYMVVDLSESMNAYDIPPSRLEKVKYELRYLINNLATDRIGIIIFAAEGEIHCPLTHDRSALLLYTDLLRTEIFPSSGTNLNAGLRLAAEKLILPEKDHREKTSGLILLITDGEDFEGEWKETAVQIRKNNINFFALAIGSGEGSKIPVKTGFKKDKEGNHVITKMNREILKEMVREAEGKYFEITETTNETTYLLESIKTTENVFRESVKVDVSGNKYFYFLLTAVMLIIIDILITIRTIRI